MITIARHVPGRRIDAVIVGAQRCATTSLAEVLGGHPQIRLAVGKEAHLFDDADVQARGIDDDIIAAAFGGPDRLDDVLLLDATPSYLYLPGALDALAAHNPAARVIVVLRNPGDRAVSHHRLERGRDAENLPLLPALLAEAARLMRGGDPLAAKSAARVHSYVDRGRYARQVSRLLTLFPDALVLGFTDLIEHPDPVLARVTEFLGVAAFAPGTAFPWRNGDERAHDQGRGSRRLARAVLAASVAVVSALLARDIRRTERMLGWPAGTLGPRRSIRRTTWLVPQPDSLVPHRTSWFRRTTSRAP